MTNHDKMCRSLGLPETVSLGNFLASVLVSVSVGRRTLGLDLGLNFENPQLWHTLPYCTVRVGSVLYGARYMLPTLREVGHNDPQWAGQCLKPYLGQKFKQSWPFFGRYPLKFISFSAFFDLPLPFPRYFEALASSWRLSQNSAIKGPRTSNSLLQWDGTVAWLHGTGARVDQLYYYPPA